MHLLEPSTLAWVDADIILLLIFRTEEEASMCVYVSFFPCVCGICVAFHVISMIILIGKK